MNAFVYFHQGWTDLIICLPLIDYYLKKYDHVSVIIRSDAKEFVDFYLRTKHNVTPIYINTDNGRFYGNFFNSDVDYVIYEPEGYYGNIIIPNTFDILTHAEHDFLRKDTYKHYWSLNNYLGKSSRHFSESFYTFYDIPFYEKVESFNLDRDYDLENKTFNEFIENYGDKYIVYHDDQENHLHGSLHVPTKIDFINKLDGYNYVNLNKVSNKFFDYIMVLKNSKQIHLVDSIWAGICYQLDAKYSLFKDIEIFLYAKRGHGFMFENPIKLQNWIIYR